MLQVFCCKPQHKDVHILTDASKNAIAAIAFQKVWKGEENSDIGFLMGISWDRDSRNHQRTDGFREEEFQVLQ